MTEPTPSELRDLLQRSMVDAPSAHPWDEVRRRAATVGDDPTARRRPLTTVAVVAAAVILVATVAVLASSGDDSTDIRTIDQPTTTEDSAASTSVPAAPTTTTPSTTPGENDDGRPGGRLGDVDTGSLRPLADLAAGDVVVPTAAGDWLVTGSGSTRPEDAVEPGLVESFVNLIEPRSGPVPFGQIVYLTLSREELCTNSLGCQPTGESVTIDGVTWEAIGVARIPDDDTDFVDHGSLRARIGDRWLSLEIGAPDEVDGQLLDEPGILELLQGLRAGSPDDLAAIGVAADPAGERITGEVPLDAFDPDDLRPLDTLSPGDVIVPTAPADWTLHPQVTAEDTARSEFVVGTGISDTLEVYVGPACDDAASTCATSPFPIGWPPIEQVEIGGHLWGYPPTEPQFRGDIAAVVGDRTVLILGTWYESRLPLLEDPLVVEFIEGLRAGSLDDLPDTVELTDPQGTPLDQTTGEAPPKSPVASTELGDATLVLNAAVTGDQVCLTLDRADNDLNVWPVGCRQVTALDGTVVLDLAQLGRGPAFNTLGPGQEPEYLLVGYVDTPDAVDVRATAGDVSVDGRTAGPNDVADGVFVLMPVNELDDVIDFEGGFSTSEIRLAVTDPSG